MFSKAKENFDKSLVEDNSYSINGQLNEIVLISFWEKKSSFGRS